MNVPFKKHSGYDPLGDCGKGKCPVCARNNAVFRIKSILEKDEFFAKSRQLYKEGVLASGIDKVYDLGFVYRAEPHHTTRHLCEYMSFDVEMVATSLNEILDLEEKMMAFVIGELKKRHADLLKEMDVELHVPKKIPRMTLHEANKIFKSLKVKTQKK